MGWWDALDGVRVPLEQGLRHCALPDRLAAKRARARVLRLP